MALDVRNTQAAIKARLPGVEPFKPVVEALGAERSASTDKLVAVLKGNGIMLFDDERKSEEALRKQLVKWGVRVKLLFYDPEAGSWMLA